MDVFGDVLVVAPSAWWVQQHQDALQRLLLEVTGAARVVWRPSEAMLKAEGWDVTTLEAAAAAPDDDVVVEEGGVRFHAALTTGQKTGFYCDQRDARAVVAACVAAQGPKTSVLDLCCYTGGFALAAAVAGGTAHGVDSSEASVQLAGRNAVLNGVEERYGELLCCFQRVERVNM